MSLVPSATETLACWGVTPVAVTRFCERPDLTAVGGTKDPDLAAVVALAPDLVVLCDEENRREDAEALRAAGLPIHVVTIRRLTDVKPELERLAAAVEVTGDLEWPPFDDVPVQLRAFVPIWRRPWMTLNGDTYGSALLESIGVANVFAARDERYPETTLDDVAVYAPDVVLAPSEPYPFGARHVAELEWVAPVVLVDGQDLFWWGTRTPAARERLRQSISRR